MYEARRRSFAELDDRTSRLAQALLADGVKPGDRVAHLDQNSPECVELLFAAAKLGAVAVPLDWRLARPELETILSDADAALLVCGPDYAEPASSLADRVIVAGPEYEEWLAGFGAEDPGFEARPDDVAFQLYTSGTTGRPKGVLTTTATSRRCPASRSAGRWTAIRWRWSRCRCFISGPRLAARRDGPGRGCVLVGSIEPGALVETMVSEPYGASPITTTTLKAALRTFGCLLFQVYGLTETTGAIVQLEPEDHDPDGPRAHLLRSAGRPYPWVELRVVSADTGDECPIGQVGRDPGPRRGGHAGLLPRPGRDRSGLRGRLVLHRRRRLPGRGRLPVSDRPGQGHDLSGGENVYPIEVEEALASHADVSEVAVIGLPDERWGEVVTAVVVVRGEHEIDADALVAHAAGGWPATSFRVKSTSPISSPRPRPARSSSELRGTYAAGRQPS